MTENVKEVVEVKATVAPTLDSIIKRVNELVKERELFESVTQARSNKELGLLLQKVLTLFKDASKDATCLKECLKHLKAILHSRGIKVQVNSPAITVFVRYVFNSDRKRAYNYTRTLMAAIKANILPEDLPDFITSKGGVEECKKEYSKSLETLQKEQALTSAIDVIKVELETMDPVEILDLPDASVHLSDDCEYAFTISRIIGENQLGILRTIPTTTKAMESSAFKELAKALIEDEKNAKEIAKADKKDVATSIALSTMTIGQVEAIRG